jgi:hypothetical protein
VPQHVPEQVRKQVNDIWEADLALQIMLLLLVLTLFVLVPMAGLGLIDGNGDLIAAAGFSVLGVSGVFAVTRTRSARILGLIAMTAPIGLGWYNALTPGVQAGVPRAALTLVAILWMAFLTLQHVFRSGPITPARLQGAIAVYLLLAIAFGEAYWLIAQFQPGAFHLPQEPGTLGASRAGLFYFSLTTLTTLGYGDILPVGAVARSLATLEGLVGQLYPAVLIGRLVSLQITTSQEQGRKAENQ